MTNFGPTKWRAELAAWIEANRDFPLAGKERVGTAFFRVCRACGRFEWQASTPVPDDDLRIVVEDMDATDCADCRYVATRTPELGNWVVGLVAHQIKLWEERAELQMREQIRAAMTAAPEPTGTNAEVDQP